jgi:hypothetical protein
VNRVRRKIDAGASKPLIHTRRGAGYVLAASEDSTGSGASDARSPGEQRKTNEAASKRNHA